MGLVIKPGTRCSTMSGRCNGWNKAEYIKTLSDGSKIPLCYGCTPPKERKPNHEQL